MKCLLFCSIFLLTTVAVFAQEDENIIPTSQEKQDSLAVTDKKYREDQFYASVTYNLLGNKTNGVSQSGFSSGFHFGFIRDMPINVNRNVAIGIGIGLSTNSYNQNLLISEVNNNLIYEVLTTDTSFSKNKFTTYVVEIPIEFRWRTSTIPEYDFWRIYTGIKFGYIMHSSSKYEGNPEDFRLSGIDDFNKLQYGLTLSAGYSKVNFYFYYGLNTIFSNKARLNSNNEGIDMNTIKIGLIFYIL